MRLLITLFIFILSFIYSSAYADPFRLMVFGDSLSAGYHLPKQDAFYAQLEETLQQQGYDVSVINASHSGDTTVDGLNRIQKAINQNPDAVLLELGINDAFRHTPIEAIRKNLGTLIQTFQDNQISVLLIGMQLPAIYEASYSQQFSTLYTDLSKHYDLILYPFFMDGLFKKSLTGPKPVANLLLSDNLHPNKQGVQTVVSRLLPTVKQFLKKQGVYPQK